MTSLNLFSIVRNALDDADTQQISHYGSLMVQEHALDRLPLLPEAPASLDQFEQRGENSW